MRTMLKKMDLTSPPSYSLFHAYELQRDQWLAMVEKDRNCQVDNVEYDRVWAMCTKKENQHNLIYGMDKSR